jgi:RNA polymerase sigma-70 factor (ECF subfamily)
MPDGELSGLNFCGDLAINWVGRRHVMQTPNTNQHSDSSGLGNEAEVDLVHRIALQDQYAFEVLYRIYYRRLTRFLDRITRRPHANEEVLDDTMFAVWRKAVTFNGTSQVSTLIFAIAYRMALKALKRDRAGPGGCSTMVSQFRAQSGGGADRGANQVRIKRLLADLSPERAVVEPTYYHGCAYKEIARSRLPGGHGQGPDVPARRKLRAVLIAEEGD